MASLSGILNLPKLEQMFGQLVSRIAQQETELARLRNVVEADGLERRLASLERRISVCEQQSTVPGYELGAGRCAAANRAAIGKLADVVEGKVGEKEARRALEDMQRTVAAESASTRQACASLELGRKLETTCAALTDRLALAEAALATKVDASLAAGIEATCERLRAADETLAKCSSRLDVHDAALVTCAWDLDRRAEALEAAATASAAREAARDKAEASSAERLAIADRRLASAEAAISVTDTALAVDRAEAAKQKEGFHERCNHCQELARSLAAATRTELARECRGLSHDIERINDAADARDAVSRAAHRDDLKAFARQLNRDHIDDIRKSVAALQAAQANTKHSLDLALDFVDWFANRGQAYEHNLNAIDNSLRNLVLADRGRARMAPPHREPYRTVRISPP